MRILHVISSLDPALGGPQEGLSQFRLAAEQLSHHIEIVTLDDADAPWLAHSHGVHAMGPFHSSYRYTPRLVPWLRDNAHHYDVVIVNGIWQYHGLAVWRVLRNSKLPYVVYTHGMLDPWFKKAYPLKHLKKWLYWPWVEYRVLRDAAAVFFTCEEERLLARRSFWLYRCREAVPGYGIAVPPGDAGFQKEFFLQRFPHLRGRRIILFLSRLHPKKGCDLLIDAFARMAGKDELLHLVMAGPDQTGWLRELRERGARHGVAERITWTGMLSGDLKWGAFHAADVFALPSHQENFGIAVAEALACGLPVLISDKVNIWREIEADGAGLVSADDLAGTVFLLESWAKMTPVQKAGMREKARHCFLERFQIVSSTKRVLHLLDEIRRGRQAARK